MEPKKKPAARRASTGRAKSRATSTHHHRAKPESVTSPAQPVASSAVVMPQGATTAEHSGSGLPSRRNWAVIGGTVLGLIVVFLIIFGVLIYKYRNDSRIVQFVAGIVPYPAESVNGHWASYSDYLFEVNSVKHYYMSQTTADGKSQVNFTTPSGKKQLVTLQNQVLQELQQEAIVKQIAAKNHLSVNNDEVQKQVDQITKSAGGDAKVKSVLAKYYGWSINDLKRKIRFQLLQQKVTNQVQNDPGLNAQAHDKANQVLKKVQSGGDFGALAKQYSQDSSAANGGDLGFFSKTQVPNDFAKAVFALQPGQVSGVLKTQYGYSIVKVVEYNADHTQVHADQILIKTIDVNQYLQDQLNKAKVHQYIHPA